MPGPLAGLVRKTLGLDLLSEAGESGRVYRISDRTGPDEADGTVVSPEWMVGATGIEPVTPTMSR